MVIESDNLVVEAASVSLTTAVHPVDAHLGALDNKTSKSHESARAHLQWSENVGEMSVEYCRIVVRARRVSNF